MPRVVAPLRQSELVARERRTGGTSRVEPVVFAAQPPLATRSAARLQHRFAAAAQIASEAGAVMACSLNRPDTPAARVLVGEAQRLRVAVPAGRDRLLRDNSTRRCGNDREHVLIAVCVDADDVVHLVCKHLL
jgi:hypothetical protein